MKGIKRYLRKHGYHFTKELVEDVIPLKWNVDSVMDSAQKKVYYNVTGATPGDMAYLAHWLYYNNGWPQAHDKNTCVSWTLWFIGNHDNHISYFFTVWLSGLSKSKKKFDFTPYI